ncbi:MULTISPECIES: anti-sigma regulatory factor [unclassified Lentimicrobium]|uniref:anti-sigma regulatory factor n=1 Tax=unclassified Lentimicrobium TaxID=2677434 RepID=UPI001553F4B6|nr:MULTISPECIES: anti-sigma regulatory factor [unclassified Lentimicrobium]NPD45951.1 anti-sigma regulatory factor [Lentimicrobium sp. S6]NPD84282.1 anti-sigma regulatory factor [Lentimicrobium sp. L6]
MQAFEYDSDWTELGVFPVKTENDIVKVRQMARQYAKDFKMGIVEQTRITTAVSELLRNMYQYANGGEVTINQGYFDGHNALIFTFEDQGPGIENLDLAMSDGYTSGGGMGYGLPGAKRLVDSFEIRTEVNTGTLIRLMKWK